MRPAAGRSRDRVVAAAVILHPRRRIRGLADSKVLSPEERARLAPISRARALAWAIGWADRDEIDCLNILEATLLAMRRALLALPVVSDPRGGSTANRLSVHLRPATGVHARGHRGGGCAGGGHQRASILAKVYRRCHDASARCVLSGFRAGSAQRLRYPRPPSALQLRAPSRHAPARSFSPLRQD